MNQAFQKYPRLLLIASFLTFSGHAMAIECTKPVKSDKELDVDSKVALGAFRTLLKALNWDLNVKASQKEIYSKYPHADQLATNDNFMYMVCTTLKDSKLEPAKQLEVLMTWHKEIFRPEIPIPSIPTPPRTNTDVVIPLPIPPAATPSPSHPHPVPPSAPAWIGSAQKYRENYLREPPSVLTDENNKFVIASSPDSADQADAIYKKLTSAYPSVDFMIYPPYQSNTHYALMLGTWLSSAEAQRVLQIGKSMGLNPYLWTLGSSAQRISESTSDTPARINSKTMRPYTYRP